MDFFTSITANYMPKALVLAESIKKYNKDARVHLLLSDDIPKGRENELAIFDSIIGIEDLEVPVDDLQKWIFKHTVVELCTAVKGQAFLHIHDKFNAEKIVYLDPDTAVFDSLIELENLLDEHSVVITPHQTVPEEDLLAIMDNEICSLKHGTYNLGFLAIKMDEKGEEFAKWWRDRLVEFCYDDIPNGIFTDQKWVDLAPALFDYVYILREKGYNVSTWNISHRYIEFDENINKYTIDGKTLKFYHFSGFDSGNQKIMLERYAKGNENLYALREWYIEQQNKYDQEFYGKIPGKYDSFQNGEKITKEHRQVYRNRQDVIDYFSNPFVASENIECYYNWFINEYLKGEEKENLKVKEYELEQEIKELKSQLAAIKSRSLREKIKDIFISK